jgi:serine protease Do
VPVFVLGKNGALEGIGTAFHVNRRGALLTAYHVVDDGIVRAFAVKTHVAQLSEPQPYVLYGGFRGYGRFPIPDGAMARVGSIHSKIKRSDNPLTVLQNRDAENAADIAILRTERHPIGSYVDSLPMRLSGKVPCVGDTVIAIGFPHLSSSTTSQGLHELSNLEMQAGYGKIVNLHPNGNTKTNPTPVIEVEADWVSGMSGGPVFNESGEAIGLVSRSLSPGGDSVVGTAYAVSFHFLPTLLPWLNDVGVPLAEINFRIGY